MKFKTFIVASIILLFICSCKTTESVNNEPVYEPTQQELEQTKVDTTAVVTLSPDELRRITLMAHNAAQLYCSMKPLEDKDMNDINVAKDYDQLYQAYYKIQNEVKTLGSMGLIEYERVFEEAKEKCE